MHIKSILPAVALALAATLGSASAADQFTTLDGLPAATMSAGEMAVVRGSAVIANSKATPAGGNPGTANAITVDRAGGPCTTFCALWFGKAAP